MKIPCEADQLAKNGTGDHAAAAARRQAVNTVPQGSAADLVKLVMIQLAEQLPQRFPEKGCRLLLQVIWTLFLRL